MGLVLSFASLLEQIKNLNKKFGNYYTKSETDSKLEEVGGGFEGTLDDVDEGTTNKHFTATEKTKLSGIAESANNYTHPANHSPSIIIQDSSNRFVTDTEKSTWNNKANALGSDDNYVTDAEKTKLSNLSGINTGDQDLSGYLALGGGTMTGNILTNSIVIEGAATSYGNQETIFINTADSDPFSITMPDPTTMFGVRITIYVIAIGDGNCTLDFSDKLNNSVSNPVLTSADIGKSMMVVSDGAVWWYHKFDLL